MIQSLGLQLPQEDSSISYNNSVEYESGNVKWKNISIKDKYKIDVMQ